MASEVIKLNLIPKGEMPVFHASQFDTGRLITCELYRGEDAYSVPEGYTVELHCRKVDNNIVTMTSTLINDNVVTFTSTEQLTACNGNNLCEVAILDEGYRIGTLNFILEVEIDPLKGGITSTSEIHNLESQVEEITTEIIGENYYDKSEVDDLLSAKADSDSVYTIGEVNTLLSGKANASDVYTKSQTDTLLNAKANSSDVYTKGQVDTALAGKADVSDLPDMDLYYTKTATDTLLAAKADASTVTAALATKADKSDTYTKEQVDALIDNIFPTFTVSGNIATFTTALTKQLVSITTAEGATMVTRCGVNVWDCTKQDNVGVNATTGNLYASAGTFTTDYIKVAPNTAYYANPTNWKTWACFYDASKTYVNYKSIVNGVINTTAEAVYMRISGDMNELSTACINYSATDTTYHPYTGNTVPVADADTLTTIAGVNNIYADSGEVTVQYKYMSM
jgi:hypothetical protein